ncbi:DUF1698 domain-containing protein [Ciceribacter sp. L1K23]|uniref:class I SAM-dependent methyltransferase n=1 Tax=Ciceribacter sp. L1K23 TaxID=2820276 RepID=UPI001B81C338|nr:class I SAM-dependent methyltransferase [Ciceribacter sp. L1K23]MBR0555652.1 DUF1698 domain-containing protein [Ciceribacter sp. L1K23]
MGDQALQESLGNYDWYHIVDLPGGLQTPGRPHFKYMWDLVIQSLDRIDFAGKRVLDIGCRDGLFSFHAEEKGAAEIIGIDNFLSKGAVEVVIPARKSKVQMVEMNVNDLTRETFGTFDVIIFAGVLYHLRYPFWVMKRLQECLNDGGVIIIETGVLLSMNQHPMMFCPAGEVKGPYDPTSCTFFNITGMRCTLQSMGFTKIKVESMIQHIKGGHAIIAVDEKNLDKTFDRKIGRAVFSAIKTNEAVNDKWVDDYWDGIQDPEELRKRGILAQDKPHQGKEATVTEAAATLPLEAPKRKSTPAAAPKKKSNKKKKSWWPWR